ncbi:MAG: hypothetical protein V4618_05645 [Pseudomonadota bacterium]
MECYYHISKRLLEVGTRLKGNGLDKIDERIEDALERAMPRSMISRRDAIFMRPVPDFTRCGVADTGYIYLVEPVGITQFHDLSWLGPMELAQLKAKHPQLSKHADWSPDLVDRCCEGYWSGTPADQLVWEILSSEAIVTKRLTDEPVSVDATKGLLTL